MIPDTLTSLVIVALAVVPGFIATSAWARSRTWQGPQGDLRTILQSIACSTVIQTVAAPLTILLIAPVRGTLLSHPDRIAVWAAVVVLALPIVLGLSFARLTDRAYAPLLVMNSQEVSLGFVRRALLWLIKAPSPVSAWDYMVPRLLKNQSHYLVVEFSDGRKVAGLFSSESIAFTTPDRRGMFLEEEWQLNENGDFAQPIVDSAGILIYDCDDVRYVRILNPAE